MMKPDGKNTPPTAQTGQTTSENEWAVRAREAFRTSTTYVDSNFRKQWEDSIRAFHNKHPSDSKYSSPAYDKRSRLFRPKVRSTIRKTEAAAAAAFFSNMDVISLKAEDETSKAQLASAETMKALMQYRLRKSIPWFLFVQGGIQDAQVVGTAAAHIYWDYREEDESGSENPKEAESAEETEQDSEYPTQKDLPKGAFTMGGEQVEAPQPEQPTPEAPKKRPYRDCPVMDLLPIENIRIDPGAHWMDPVNTSPYIIHLIPMFRMDVKARMESGEWFDIPDDRLDQCTRAEFDSTRLARQKNGDDPQGDDTRAYSDISIIWVQRHIHRKGTVDYEFYMIGDIEMLCDPRPLREVVFHGKRPYVLGTYLVETHRVFKSSVPEISKGLQDEANEIVNQRIDNVKFALNKKWFAKRGKDVDVGGLVRNVPGGVVMMDDPTNDVREISWPDVTSSAYEEQNRINLDMDELLGNFNPAALMMQGAANAPARNMALLSQTSGTVIEYGIRTYVETFVEPCLRQLILLEQEYETDETILALAAKKAQLFQRFGIDQVTDELLKNELTLVVNVGMGATDPMQKLNKFLTAINTISNIAAKPIPGVNMNEVISEVFTHLGYTAPDRFFTTDNPQVTMLQQQLQQAMGAIQQLQTKLRDKTAATVVGLQKTRETNATKERIAVIQEDAANKRSLATHITAIMENSRGNGSQRPARSGQS
jgi:hypothetical protein